MVRDRILLATLGVSLLFHLSMVTLFSIYVWVPVNRPKYAQLEIRYREPGRLVLADLDTPLQLPTLGPSSAGTDTAVPITGNLTIGGAPAADSALPEISLPALDPAQLERAELIASRLRVESAFEPGPRQDSWGRFIGQIGKLDDRLREFASIESVFKDEAARQRSVAIAKPAPGIAIYVEWAGEPYDRKPALGAPFDALWRTDAAALARPISIPFKVDALGKVVSVLAPPTGDDLLSEVADALRQSSFAPIEDPAGPNQIGTLVVAPESAP